MLEKCRAVSIKRFNDKSVVFPTRNSPRFNRSYSNKAIFAKRKLPNNRSVIADKQAVIGLRDLQRLAKLEKDLRGHP